VDKDKDRDRNTDMDMDRDRDMGLEMDMDTDMDMEMDTDADLHIDFDIDMVTDISKDTGNRLLEHSYAKTLFSRLDVRHLMVVKIVDPISDIMSDSTLFNPISISRPCRIQTKYTAWPRNIIKSFSAWYKNIIFTFKTLLLRVLRWLRIE
jgi:hypothetical protein